MEAWGGDMSTWSLQGFHRYSTDQHWHVPHFEKMLYDQGQLAATYSRAFQVRPWHHSAGGLTRHAECWLGRAGLFWGSSFKACSPRRCPSHGHGAVACFASSTGVHPETLHKSVTV